MNEASNKLKLVFESFIRLKHAAANVFIHRSKFEYFGKQLNILINNVQPIVEGKIGYTHDKVAFKALKSEISELTTLAASNSKSSWTRFTLRNSVSEPDEFLTIHIPILNEALLSLQFAKESPFTWKNEESINFHQKDLKDLRDILAKDGNTEFESKIDEIDLILSDDSSLFIKWRINYEDIEIQKRLGEGTYGEVYLGYIKSNGSLVAIKSLKHDMKDNFKKEATILSRLQHFAILPFVGVCIENRYSILTQYVCGGSIYDRIHDHTNKRIHKLTPTQKTIIALGIAYGMSYVHMNNIIHRDLKPTNIILDADDNPVICDFGEATFKAECMESGIGTPQYMAPEIFESRKYTEKVDVYSYGILLWEMLTGDTPYRGHPVASISFCVRDQNKRPTIPDYCSKNFATFIQYCWDKDPEKRPDFKQIVHSLESGRIYFPGTIISALKKYISQFGSHTLEVIDLPPIQERPISELDLEQIQADLKTSYEPVYQLIGTINSPDFLIKITQYDIVPSLLNQLSKCNDQIVISHMITLLASILMDPKSINIFNKNNGTQKLLAILTQYNTSVIPNLLDCFILILQSQKIMFSQNELTRLSLFLICSDLKVRSKALKLIKSILNLTSYQQESHLLVFIDNLMMNAQPEQHIQILTDVLEILCDFLEFKHVDFRTLFVTDDICNLTKHSDSIVRKLSFHILLDLFQKGKFMEQTIPLFVSQFPVVMTSFDKETQIFELQLFSNFLQYKSFEKAIEIEMIKTINKFLKSPDILIQQSILQIVYSLSGCELVSSLLLTLLTLASSADKSISLLSLYCILSIIAKSENPVKHLKVIKTLNFKPFLDRQDDSTVVCLKIIGILSSRADTLSVILDWGIFNEIFPLIESENESIQKHIVMILISFTSFLPDSELIQPFIHTLCEMMEQNLHGELPIICLSNALIAPQNAEGIEKYLISFLNNLGTKGQAKFTFKALESILSYVDVSENIEFVKILIQVCHNYWNDENYEEYMFNILDSISQSPAICKILRETEVDKAIRNKENKYENNLSDPIRIILFRILSRIESIE